MDGLNLLRGQERSPLGPRIRGRWGLRVFRAVAAIPPKLHSLEGGDQPGASFPRAVRDNDTVATPQNPAVRLHRAVDQGLVQPRDRLDDRLGGLDRALAEGHPRDIPCDEFLEHHGHGAVLDVQAQLLPVQQGRIGPKGGPDLADMGQDSARAPDVQERLVEAGKGLGGGVLSDGRGTHGQRPAGGRPAGGRRAPGEALDRLPKSGFQFLRKGGAVEETADSQGGVPHLLPAHVLGVFAPELEYELAEKPRGADEPMISGGGQAQGLRDREPRGGQPGQGVALAAHQRPLGGGDPLEAQDEGREGICHSCTFWNELTRE